MCVDILEYIYISAISLCSAYQTITLAWKGLNANVGCCQTEANRINQMCCALRYGIFTFHFQYQFFWYSTFEWLATGNASSATLALTTPSVMSPPCEYGPHWENSLPTSSEQLSVTILLTPLINQTRRVQVNALSSSVKTKKQSRHVNHVTKQQGGSFLSFPIPAPFTVIGYQAKKKERSVTHFQDDS